MNLFLFFIIFFFFFSFFFKVEQPSDEWCFNTEEWKGVLRAFTSVEELKEFAIDNDVVNDYHVRLREKELLEKTKEAASANPTPGTSRDVNNHVVLIFMS